MLHFIFHDKNPFQKIYFIMGRASFPPLSLFLSCLLLRSLTCKVREVHHLMAAHVSSVKLSVCSLHLQEIMSFLSRKLTFGPCDSSAKSLSAHSIHNTLSDLQTAAVAACFVHWMLLIDSLVKIQYMDLRCQHCAE